MVSIVILASGFSNRMGRDKLIIDFKGSKIIEYTILNAVKSKAYEVLVVYRNEYIKKIAETYGAKAVFNENANNGQSQAVICGIKNLNIRDGVLFLPGDMPFFDVESINRLIDEYEKTKKIVCPVCLFKRRAPVIFPQSYINDLMSLTGDTGGRAILEKNNDVSEVVFKNLKLFWDIDELNDLKYSSGETVIIRGAGDIASGVALRLFRCGFNIIMLETKNPSVIRRRVAFASAVFNKEADVEGVKGILAGYSDIESLWRIGAIPVIIDENLDILNHIEVDILIDAILAKKNLGMMKSMAPLTIGLGPGFEAGVDVHAVIETNRGHNLGRVYYKGLAEKNTGTPGDVLGFKEERVLRAPCNGKVKLVKDIGDFVKKGETLLNIDELEVKSKIDGIVRGIIKDGYEVLEGMKIGDVDPRGKKEYCFTVSEKALAIAGGVLEAILNFRMIERGGESGGKGYSGNT